MRRNDSLMQFGIITNNNRDMQKFTFMKRNVRLATLLAAGCLTAAGAMAQWSSDFDTNLAISDPSTGHQGASLVKVNEAPNGRIWITWLQWEDGMNGHIKTQLMERDGTPVFEEGGIYVMNQTTSSWTSNFDAKCDPEGNLIVCHSDARNDLDNRQAFDPYVYKMDQEGNQLWGLEGVALPTTDSAGHRPKIGISNDGTIIVGYNDVNNATNNMQFVLMKINNDGTLAWDKPMPVEGAFGVLAPCGESDFYLSIIQNGKIMLYCIDSLGDYVWNQGVIIEDRDPNTRTEIVPIPDELGGVFMPYQRYVNMSTFYAGVQRVNEDGDPCLGMQGLDLSIEGGQHGAPGLGVNGERGEFVAYWNHEYDGDDHLTVQKFDYSGEPLWPEPIVLMTQYMWGYATSDGKVLDDGSSILVYGRYNSAVKLNIMATRLSIDGDEIWTKELSPEAYTGRPDAVWDGNMAYIFWEDNRVDNGPSPYGTIWGQNLNLTTGEGGPSAGIEKLIAENEGNIASWADGTLTYTGAAGEIAVYNAAGAKVFGTMVSEGTSDNRINLSNGLYIVTTPAGSMKIMK